MPTRIQLSVLLICAVLVWAGLLAIQGADVSISMLKPFGSVVGFLVLVLVIFDIWAWKWCVWRGWLVKVPNLNGTWKGSVESKWVNPATGTTPERIEAYYVVRQNYSRLSIRLLTAESDSELVTGNICRNEDGTFNVVGVFRNSSRMSQRSKSPIHYGGIVLKVVGSPKLSQS